jgi:hypothetical protein
MLRQINPCWDPGEITTSAFICSSRRARATAKVHTGASLDPAHGHLALADCKFCRKSRCSNCWRPVTLFAQHSSHYTVVPPASSVRSAASSGHPAHSFPLWAGSISVTTFRMTRAGLPATMVNSGTLFVTTLPAPTTQPLPTVTPGRKITFPPIQQSSPMWISFPSSGPQSPRRTTGSAGWVPE